MEHLTKLKLYFPPGAADDVFGCFCCSAQRVTELQELLNIKEHEMKVMEDRFRGYLEKANSVSTKYKHIPAIVSPLQYSNLAD